MHGYKVDVAVKICKRFPILLAQRAGRDAGCGTEWLTQEMDDGLEEVFVRRW